MNMGPTSRDQLLVEGDAQAFPPAADLLAPPHLAAPSTPEGSRLTWWLPAHLMALTLPGGSMITSILPSGMFS